MRGIFNSTFDEVLRISWPTLFIAIVLVATIRIGYLIKHQEEFVFYREMLYLFFMLYILCLFELVTKDDLNAISNNNFTLFKEMFRYKVGSRLFYRNILGNVLMFIPYGFFASYYIDIKKPLTAFLIIAMASISIEITQLVIGRVFDVDDILLNIFGGMFGYVLYRIIYKTANLLPKFFRSKIFLNIITTIILILGLVFIIWR